MENKEPLRFLDSCPQEQLAYAWAVADCAHRRVPVQERHIARYRSAAYHLSTPFALELLADVPSLVIP